MPVVVNSCGQPWKKAASGLRFLNKGDLVTVTDKHGRAWTERVAEDTPYMFPVQTVPLHDRTDAIRRTQRILSGVLNAIPR